MRNSELKGRVANIFSGVQKEGKRTKFGHIRFIPITHLEGTKLVEYGMYDYETKKYCLHNCYSNTIENDLRELEQFTR